MSLGLICKQPPDDISVSGFDLQTVDWWWSPLLQLQKTEAKRKKKNFSCRKWLSFYQLMPSQVWKSPQGETEFIRSHVKVWLTVHVTSIHATLCWKRTGINEVECTEKIAARMVETMVVGEAWKAIFWHASGLKDRTCVLTCFRLKRQNLCSDMLQA